MSMISDIICRLKRITLKRELLMGAVCLNSAFMVYFFSPSELYLGNASEFIVDGAHILVPMLIMAAAVFGILLLIANLMLFINKKLAQVFCCLMLGGQLASLCQTLFLNGEMKTMDGSEADYESITFFHMADYVIWLVLLLLPLILFVIKCFKPNLGKEVLASRTGAFLAAAMFAMQSAGILSLIAKNGLGKSQEDAMPLYFSYKNALDLSADDQNIVVVLTDRLDSHWVKEELELYPELYDMLEGFTFYSDNVSEYYRTFPSVAVMLTDMDYTYQAKTYFELAWAGDTLCSRLKDNGWTVNLIPDCGNIFSNISQLDGKCDNVVRASEDEYRYVYFEEVGIVPSMLRLSLSRLLPYMMKKIVVEGMSSSVSNQFVRLKYTDYTHYGFINEESDCHLYHYLKNTGITTNAKGKVFSFLHTSFAHDINDELTQEILGYTSEDNHVTIRASYEMIDELFTQMKEKGIYDSSTIILAADHGEIPKFIEIPEGKDITETYPASLMIKPAGAERKPLVVNDEDSLSTAYFAASVLEYAGIDHSEVGYSYNDVIAMEDQPDRYYAAEYATNPMLYKITGNAFDLENWHLIQQASGRNKK